MWGEGRLETPGSLGPEEKELLPDTPRGGSAVIGPDGRYIAGPIFDEETVLTAEIDLSEIDREKMTLDVSGHYGRPDVFGLTLNRGSRE